MALTEISIPNLKSSNHTVLRPFDISEISQRDRRRYPRLSTKTPSFFSQGPWYKKKKAAGITTNRSETGLCFEINDKIVFSKDAPIQIRVRFSKSSGASTISGKIIRSGFASNGSTFYAIQFAKPLTQYKTENSDAFKKFIVSVFVVAAIVTLGLIKMQHIRWFWYDPLLRFYTLMTAVFIGSRFFLSLLYEEPADHGYLPSVSVIIAVKNEEKNITETIHHCFQSRYPKDRLDVIVIDDGSTDDTWGVLDRLRPRYPELRLIKFPENKGKRHAMAIGAEQAKGEILVYVDSDSFVEPDGIYRLVQSFVDPSVGAAAGHTQVKVEASNVISKMEAVRYFISHQLFKTAESIFGTVTCCPGAFSAYRRNLVLAVLPAWLNQKFLGVQATFGDDRSLTNYILRNHKVLYHAGAVCYTYVPQRWSQFFRQQLRWKKSWARETTVAARIMINKHPLAALFYFVAIALPVLSPIVFLRAFLYSPLVLGTPVLPYFYGIFFIYMTLSLYYFLSTYRSHWYCGILFAFVYMTVLCWQTYYAILTVNKTHWGTR